MSQYLVKSENIENGKFYVTSDEARHISKAARHNTGDVIKIFDGKGLQYLAEISGISGDLVSGRIIEKIPFSKPKIKLTLCFGLVDKKTIENILNLCTQAGVYAFQPVITERVQSCDIKSWKKRHVKAKQIFISTCKQCERALLPKLYSPLNFDEALKKYDKGFICCLGNEGLKISKAFAKLEKKYEYTGEIAVFVGPVGDFTADEISSVDIAGLIKITLGKNILKTETACIAASSLILNLI